MIANLKVSAIIYIGQCAIRNQKQKSFISASTCIFKRSHIKRHRLGFGDTNS